MLSRFLMAVLIACLALPAAAMPLAHPAAPAAEAVMDCHGKSAPAPAHHPQSPAPMKHDCIGCIAPLGFVPAASEPLALPGQPPVPALTSAAALARSGPDTPPPKA
ncbi:hypothetical protein [Novosphingobium sp.]|uniref:hypothetical protein n=1 Tax=Novosphingobium sp. TaxID=1874826 RepID=UPI0027357F24|nr:hypothetical protein [Novosphingobium sp.]MDP3905943.1 hypothetical protein [Novosphingobium sp.]